jgi:hypothetical protein
MISLKKYLDSDFPEFVRKVDDVGHDPFAVALDAYGSVLLEMGNCSLDACPGIGGGLNKTLGQLKAELSPAMSQEKLVVHGEKAREELRLGTERGASLSGEGA